ncbi:MAG: toll/interleukin-1 receptor domain-containing protein, partial [Burkholderiales bacterium]
MKIFLSYSSKDRTLAEPVYLALRAEQHAVFFDRTDLPPGEEYDARIREAIEDSDLLIFLISPDSLRAGAYTLTEL